jgi:hypothetical protein
MTFIEQNHSAESVPKSGERNSYHRWSTHGTTLFDRPCRKRQSSQIIIDSRLLPAFCSARLDAAYPGSRYLDLLYVSITRNTTTTMTGELRKSGPSKGCKRRGYVRQEAEGNRQRFVRRYPVAVGVDCSPH